MTADVEYGPDGGVLRIRLRAADQTVVVTGWCRYWVDGDEAGGYACPDHPDIGGPVSWRWTGQRFVRDDRMPDGVTVLHGEWVPDDVWFG